MLYKDLLHMKITCVLLSFIFLAKIISRKSKKTPSLGASKLTAEQPFCEQTWKIGLPI